MKKNKKIKVLSIFGTRPEAIKFASVLELMGRDKNIISKVCVSGQHKQMLKQVLDLFGIKPDYNLNVMKNNQTITQTTSKILNKLAPILKKEKPDIVLVQGDTTTAFAGALASYYEHIPVGHIEAGLRTGDIYQPFPEEGNRVLISRLAALHFAPTKLNYQNLIKENISAKNIFITGNTVIDALFLILNKPKSTKLLNKFLASNQRAVLITAHRRENFGKGFNDIIKAVKKIAAAHPDIDIIYPVHLNPNVKSPVYEKLSNIKNIHLINPVNYQDFVLLMNKSYIILTDSGGVQEEAPSLGKPVLVMRNKTERPEAVKAGTVKLVGTDQKKIFNEVNRLLKDKKYYEKISKTQNPYGSGKAAEKILKIIKNYAG